jgi:ZIP family zinc transporter
MWLAALYGALASSMLIVGTLLAYAFKPSPRLTAVVMALGAGLLIGSVAYDLVAEAQVNLSLRQLALALMAGALVFVLGSRIIERRGVKNASTSHAAHRKSPAPAADAESNPLSIVLGSALDGIPESFVLGLSVLTGGVSLPLLLGISLSNVPEGMAAGSGLRSRGWPAKKVIAMWIVVVLISAASAAFGHEILANDDGTWAGLAQTFAAGALLAMLADTMLPESYAVERTWTGALVVGGFAGSLLMAGLVA